VYVNALSKEGCPFASVVGPCGRQPGWSPNAVKGSDALRAAVAHRFRDGALPEDAFYRAGPGWGHSAEQRRQNPQWIRFGRAEA
jgi:hypothetical protein